MFANLTEGLSAASNPGNPLPPLDPRTVNFESGLKVVNRTTRFVIPVPELPDGGEPMVYPEGAERAGEPVKKLEDGTPERGIVFFNGKDQAWQAARGNGKEAILVNDVSREQAEALMTRLNGLGGPRKISLEGIKTLLAYARNELGITDFYDKKMAGVAADMVPVDESLPLYMIVTKPTVHSAVYIREGFTFDGPVPQVYPSGAVLVSDGRYSWGIDAGVFQRNFKAIDGTNERALKSLDEEFPRHSARLQFEVAAMTPEDLPAVIEMLRQTKGVSLKPWETPELLERAIERNPGFNLVARARDGALLAASFAGDTGLRGSFHHVTVRDEFRNNGIASALVDQTLERFRDIGVLRIINIVENDNRGGIQFWLKKGFRISTAQGGITVQMTNDLEPLGKDA